MSADELVHVHASRASALVAAKRGVQVHAAPPRSVTTERTDRTLIPAPVTVTCWGELPAERRMPGALRVLIAGESVGGAEHTPAGWVAYRHTAARRDRLTEHPTAGEAVTAVIRSGFARRLGARAASPVHWSACARRTARAPRRVVRKGVMPHAGQPQRASRARRGERL